MKLINNVVFCLLLTLFVGCKDHQKVVSTFDGMNLGTTYHIVVRADSTLTLRESIDSVFALANRSMSIYDPNSLLSAINTGVCDTLDKHIFNCLSMAYQISEQSSGAYDVTVKPLVSAYGFGESDTIQSPNIDSLMQFVGYTKLQFTDKKIFRLHPNIQIDLNSIAKGYTVDLLSQMIEDKGVSDYLVEVGGEIFCKGKNKNGTDWVVGIDTPAEGNFSPGDVLEVRLELSGKGLATSGNYRRYYTDDKGRKIVHTIDPLTGLPAIHSLLSATVVARNCAMADGYGTLFMVLGVERSIAFLAEHPELDAYLIYSDEKGGYKNYATKGLKIKQ